MIDSQGRTEPSKEAHTSAPRASSTEIKTPTKEAQQTSLDHYTFIDEISGGAREVVETGIPCKRGLKRTFEDLIKSESNVISNVDNCFEREDSILSLNLSITGDEVQSDSNVLSDSSDALIHRNNSSISSSNIEFVRSKQPPGWSTGLPDPTIISNHCNATAGDSNINKSPVAENIASVLRGTSRRGRSYGLRPRANLRRSMDDRDSPERSGRKPSRRGRGRGNTLSKYRRNTANARERDRMREINTAFATLRGALPSFACRRISSMTKITTLKLATSYIRALADLLKEPPQEPTPNLQFLSSQLNNNNINANNNNIPSTSGLMGNQEGHIPHSHPHVGNGTRVDGGHYTGCMEGCSTDARGLEGCAVENRVDSRVEGRVEGRWWSAVESDVFQAIDDEIAWDDLNLPDICWTMS